MDPNACLARLLEAIKDRDGYVIKEAASDLADWLNRGGFDPTFDATVNVPNDSRIHCNGPRHWPAVEPHEIA